MSWTPDPRIKKLAATFTETQIGQEVAYREVTEIVFQAVNIDRLAPPEDDAPGVAVLAHSRERLVGPGDTDEDVLNRISAGLDDKGSAVSKLCKSFGLAGLAPAGGLEGWTVDDLREGLLLLRMLKGFGLAGDTGSE